MNKRAEASGDWIYMMYRFLLIALIAFVIFVVAGIFYPHVLNVRESEAILITRQAADCVSLNEKILQGNFEEIENTDFFRSCGMDELSNEKYFVRAKILDMAGQDIFLIEKGDSGAIWVKKIYDNIDSSEEAEVRKYRPGYYKNSYPIAVKGNEMNLEMEVLVRYG